MQRKNFATKQVNDLRMLQLNGVENTENDAVNFVLNTGLKRQV